MESSMMIVSTGNPFADEFLSRDLNARAETMHFRAAGLEGRDLALPKETQ